MTSCWPSLLIGLLLLWPLGIGAQAPALPLPNAPTVSGSLERRPEETGPKSRVVIAEDPEATTAYEPREDRVTALVNRALTRYTGKPTVAEAWRSVIKTQDIVGVKIYASPGPTTGTRPAVVAAVIEGLLAAGLPPRHLIIWDDQRSELRRAGYYDLAARYGVRVEGAAAAGYDAKVFYDTPLLGQLVWGDLEFGRKDEIVGRKSFLSQLVTREITKIINVTPLLNHNSVGVCGNLYGLAMGSADNTHRFEIDPARLATAVPDIYALPSLSDRVALNIVDALIAQYQGEQRPLLHYAKALNQIRVSKDPVALDVLSIHELNQLREAAGMRVTTNSFELYENAALIELGVNETNRMQIERVP